MRACCAFARQFLNSSYDVAIDDVLFPRTAFDTTWRRHLAGFEWRVVIIHPTLARSSSRDKTVPDYRVGDQHQATYGWPERYRIDTTGLSVADSLALGDAVLGQ